MCVLKGSCVHKYYVKQRKLLISRSATTYLLVILATNKQQGSSEVAFIVVVVKGLISWSVERKFIITHRIPIILPRIFFLFFLFLEEDLKDFQVRNMDASQTRKQIQQMCRFIEQEAREKVNEIKLKVRSIQTIARTNLLQKTSRRRHSKIKKIK